MIRLLKKSILPVALLCGCVAANAETINGAGASFPAPVYAAWTYTYNKVNPKKDHFNYQSIGSGAGVSQLKSGVNGSYQLAENSNPWFCTSPAFTYLFLRPDS